MKFGLALRGVEGVIVPILVFGAWILAGCSGSTEKTQEPPPLEPIVWSSHTHATFWINPDGSAKINYRYQQPYGMLNNVIQNSRKVEAWSDLNIDIQPGPEQDKATFTAYIPDITDYRLNKNIGPVQINKNGSGSFKIQFGFKEKPAEHPGDISDEEARTILEKEREKRAIIKRHDPPVEFIEARVLRAEFFLPPEAQTSEHFKKTEKGSYVTEFDQMKARTLRARSVEDEELAFKLIRAGEFQEITTPIMMRLRNLEIHGTTNAPSLSFGSTGEPLFDYEAETAAAKSTFTESLQNSGIVPAWPSSPESNPLSDVKVAGLERGHRALGIKIQGTASEEVMWVKGSLLRAEDDQGRVLFPALKVLNSLSNRSTPNAARSFTMHLNSLDPAEDAIQLGQLKFILTAALASEKETIDLGTYDLDQMVVGPHGLVSSLWKYPVGDEHVFNCRVECPAPYAIFRAFNAETGNRILEGSLSANGLNTGFGRHGIKPFKRARYELTSYPDYREVAIPYEFKDVELP